MCRMWRFLVACFCAVGLVSTASADLSADLDVWLRLDGNVLDSSGKNNHGVLVVGDAGTSEYVSGKVNQGLDLGLSAGHDVTTTKTNGAYVQINYKLAPQGTIALWYQKAPSFYNYESVWDNSGSRGVLADNWECWIDSGRALWARAADGADGRWGKNEVSTQLNDDYLGEWLHIAVTWQKLTDTTMEMLLYVNGDHKHTIPAGAVWWEPGEIFYLGGGNDDNTYGIGAFDELGIWSRQLDATEIQEIFVQGVPEPSTIVLFLMGAGAFAMLRLRRRKR